MAGRKDRHTLFHRILPATARVLTSTTAVDWHVKVKDTKYNVGLTKNYFITVSMQKISSIHTLIFLKKKSQRYKVQCWSNQKLFHNSQHAKNQLNSYTRFKRKQI